MASKKVLCKDCRFWEPCDPETNSPHSPHIDGFGKCLRNSPSPCQEDGHPSDAVPGFHKAVWPHTYGAHGGCFDGEKI